MTVYKLLEQKVSGRYYLKIESNFPSQVFAAACHSILLTESLSSGSPIMSLKMVDAIGSLVNHSYISPEVSYDIFFGLNDQNARQGHFSLSTNHAESITAGTIENVAMDINFLSDKWPSMLNQTHSRSWTNKKYSDVVTQIANECGFKSIDVETSDVSLNIIQPGWTNYQMLKWIAERARSSTGSVGYDMAITTDGKFLYKTYNKFFDAQPVRSLYLYGRGATNANIYDMNFKHDYAPVMNGGGGFGVHFMYFDYDNKAFVASDIDITKTDQAQLSDWYFVPQAHLNPTRRYYGARDTDMKTRAEHALASVTNSVASIAFTMLGDANLHVGDLINVVLATNTMSKAPINEMYSGYWMVSKVTQIIDFQAGGFTTDLTLMRAGFNGVDITNFTKSQTGKVIKPMIGQPGGGTI